MRVLGIDGALGGFSAALIDGAAVAEAGSDRPDALEAGLGRIAAVLAERGLALRDLDRPLLERVATSLGLSLDAIPPRPRTPADAATSQRILDAATLEVAERLDAGPIRVRAALARFVARLAEGNIDPGTAHALLTRG